MRHQKSRSGLNCTKDVLVADTKIVSDSRTYEEVYIFLFGPPGGDGFAVIARRTPLPSLIYHRGGWSQLNGGTAPALLGVSRNKLFSRGEGVVSFKSVGRGVGLGPCVIGRRCRCGSDPGNIIGERV